MFLNEKSSCGSMFGRHRNATERIPCNAQKYSAFSNGTQVWDSHFCAAGGVILPTTSSQLQAKHLRLFNTTGDNRMLKIKIDFLDAETKAFFFLAQLVNELVLLTYRWMPTSPFCWNLSHKVIICLIHKLTFCSIHISPTSQQPCLSHLL